jgi:hypothetical protein
MSSRKAAAKPVDRTKAPVVGSGEPTGAPPTARAVSDDAVRIAAELERALADGRLDALTPEALQALTAALCRFYAAQVEAGHEILPLPVRTVVAPTDVMVTASGLLRAANLAVFELGMWQSWTGR